MGKDTCKTCRWFELSSAKMGYCGNSKAEYCGQELPLYSSCSDYEAGKKLWTRLSVEDLEALIEFKSLCVAVAFELGYSKLRYGGHSQSSVKSVRKDIFTELQKLKRDSERLVGADRRIAILEEETSWLKQELVTEEKIPKADSDIIAELEETKADMDEMVSNLNDAVSRYEPLEAQLYDWDKWLEEFQTGLGVRAGMTYSDMGTKESTVHILFQYLDDLKRRLMEAHLNSGAKGDPAPIKTVDKPWFASLRKLLRCDTTSDAEVTMLACDQIEKLQIASEELNAFALDWRAVCTMLDVPIARDSENRQTVLSTLESVMDTYRGTVDLRTFLDCDGTTTGVQTAKLACDRINELEAALAAAKSDSTSRSFRDPGFVALRELLCCADNTPDVQIVVLACDRMKRLQAAAETAEEFIRRTSETLSDLLNINQDDASFEYIINVVKAWVVERTAYRDKICHLEAELFVLKQAKESLDAPMFEKCITELCGLVGCDDSFTAVQIVELACNHIKECKGLLGVAENKVNKFLAAQEITDNKASTFEEAYKVHIVELCTTLELSGSKISLDDVLDAVRKLVERNRMLEARSESDQICYDKRAVLHLVDNLIEWVTNIAKHPGMIPMSMQADLVERLGDIKSKLG